MRKGAGLMVDRWTGAGLVDRGHGEVRQGSTRPRQPIHLCLEPETLTHREDSRGNDPEFTKSGSLSGFRHFTESGSTHFFSEI